MKSPVQGHRVRKWQSWDADSDGTRGPPRTQSVRWPRPSWDTSLSCLGDKDLWLLSRLPSPPGSSQGHLAFPAAFRGLMVISEPTCRLYWEELDRAGWGSVPCCYRSPVLPQHRGPLRPKQGTTQVCLSPCVPCATLPVPARVSEPSWPRRHPSLLLFLNIL